MDTASPNHHSRRQRAAWWVACLALAGVALLIAIQSDYWPHTLGSATTSQAIPVRTPSPEVKAMISDLERSAQQSGDPEILVRLGQAYTGVGRIDDAKAAYTQAYQRAPKNKTVLEEYAWSLYNQDTAISDEHARTVYQQLHQTEPRHPQALLLLAQNALQRGDRPAATAHWQTLLRTLPPDNALAADIRRVLSKIGDLAPSPPTPESSRPRQPKSATRP